MEIIISVWKTMKVSQIIAILGFVQIAMSACIYPCYSTCYSTCSPTYQRTACYPNTCTTTTSCSGSNSCSTSCSDSDSCAGSSCSDGCDYKVGEVCGCKIAVDRNNPPTCN